MSSPKAARTRARTLAKKASVGASAGAIVGAGIGASGGVVADGYVSAQEVSSLLAKAKERCGGLDALAKEIARVTGRDVTFQHLSRMIRGGKNGREPQGAALEYLQYERCVMYRKVKK